MLGLGSSVQPAFDAVWEQRGQLYEQRLGVARAAAMNPFTTFVGRGLVVGGGSDSPITELDPMVGAVGAREPPRPLAERMTREQAVHLWTAGGAALCAPGGEEGPPGARDARRLRRLRGRSRSRRSRPAGPSRPVLDRQPGREVFGAAATQAEADQDVVQQLVRRPRSRHRRPPPAPAPRPSARGAGDRLHTPGGSPGTRATSQERRVLHRSASTASRGSEGPAGHTASA